MCSAFLWEAILGAWSEIASQLLFTLVEVSIMSVIYVPFVRFLYSQVREHNPLGSCTTISFPTWQEAWSPITNLAIDCSPFYCSSGTTSLTFPMIGDDLRWLPIVRFSYVINNRGQSLIVGKPHRRWSPMNYDIWNPGFSWLQEPLEMVHKMTVFYKIHWQMILPTIKVERLQTSICF